MSSLVDLSTRATFARVRALEIDGQQLVALFQTEWPKAIHFKGMPADARAIGIRTLKFAVGKVVLLIESAEFPLIDCSEGTALPSLDIHAAPVVLLTPDEAERDDAGSVA